MARTPPTNSPRLALARQTRVLADVDADADVVALAAPPRAPSSRPSTPRRPSISRVHARATTSRALPSSQRRPRARSHVPTPFAARRRRPARAGVAPRVVPVVPARVPARISPRAPPPAFARDLSRRSLVRSPRSRPPPARPHPRAPLPRRRAIRKRSDLVPVDAVVSRRHLSLDSRRARDGRSSSATAVDDAVDDRARTADARRPRATSRPREGTAGIVIDTRFVRWSVRGIQYEVCLAYDCVCSDTWVYPTKSDE